MVRWANGVAIRSGDTKLLLDPLDSDPTIPDLFVTHAHHDHSRGFQFPIQKKHSTKETKELYEAETGRETGNWAQLRLGRRLQLGSIEVEAHDAGHVLGSVQFEVITHEENLVYASHLNFIDTLISRAAEVAPCDTLILEATFPQTSPTLPPRETVVADMVKWSLECVGEHRIPTFATDPIGVAQELIKTFNSWTELTVIVHPRIARIAAVYADNGIGLSYVDAGTEEAETLIREGKCVVIIPKQFDASRYGEFRIANVTAWPTQAERAMGKVFVLSDQADLGQLLGFVKETRAKTVLTFRGGSQVLAELVSKRLGIIGRSLQAEVRPAKKVKPPLDEEKVADCEDYVLGLVQERNLTYEKREVVDRAMRDGFELRVVEAALNRLTQKNSLKYSEITDGYTRL